MKQTSRNTFVLMFIMSLLVGCASMRSVDLADAMRYPPPPGVAVGSLVKLETLGGETFKFRVTEINQQGLAGSPGFFAYENLRSLKVEGTSNRGAEVGSIILGILGIAALVWAIGNSDSVSVCSPPCETPTP